MSEHPNAGEKWVEAYHRMLERVRGAQGQSTERSGLREYIGHAVDKAVELEELTREEAEKIGEYLRRDVHDAAEFLSGGGDLGQWMRFDLKLIEERFLGMFAVMVDHTREELDNLAARAEAMSEWYSGEVTGPGTLVCAECGKVLEFHQAGRIPPCPQCSQTVFIRLAEEAEETSADASDNAAQCQPADR